MQTKNLIVAIILCLAVVVGWGYLAKYMGWVQTYDEAQLAAMKAETEAARVKEEQLAARKAQEAQAARTIPAFVPAEGKEVSVETPLYKAVLYTGGGVLRSFELKQYRTGLEAGSPHINLVNQAAASVAPMGLLVNGQPSWSTGRWSFEGDSLQLEPGSGGVLRFIGEVDGIRVQRELHFNAETYLISERVSVIPLGEQPRTVRLAFTAASDQEMSSGGYYDSMRVAWDQNGSFKEETDAKDLASKGVQASGTILWAGVMSNYFMNTIVPADTASQTVKGRMQNGIYRTALEQPELVIDPGTEKHVESFYWVGPKVRSLLKDAPNDLVSSIDLGMFSIIAKGLLWLLAFFYSYVHNWGVAIILLTILIKAVFWPLTAKSYSSMEKMKKIQPMMQAIREKYKDDKEQLNKEIMGLYKTYGVNPASGCVPILVQLPVFFGLYQALLTSIELRHASFIDYLPGTDMLWLADLSAKDPFYITPIIMGLTMFLQQKMTPPAGDPTQQKIMMFLPLVFTVMFLQFPAGLVLYWLVNNILSIAQQGMMLRKSR